MILDNSVAVAFTNEQQMRQELSPRPTPQIRFRSTFQLFGLQFFSKVTKLKTMQNRSLFTVNVCKGHQVIVGMSVRGLI